VILAIDTSGKNLGLALCRNGKIEASSLSRPGLKHGEILQGEIAGFLKSSGISFKDLTGLSITLGPGSFTGLRIGLAAAKGYAYALDLPLTGISTLFAVATFADARSEKVLVVVDARRQEFYYAFFDCSGDEPERKSPDSIGNIHDIRKSISGDTIVLGPSRLKELFVAESIYSEYHVADNFNLAGPAGLWGEKQLRRGEALDKSTAVPVYLRSGF
jgi:tRNA threonylcarbamoyladenosine biosynthesis protein TsaB